MTPAPPHPEREQKYIITEFELRTLTECAGMGFGILADNTAICIRSRPHITTPSEREQIPEYSFLWNITKEEFDILKKAYLIRLRESRSTEAHR